MNLRSNILIIGFIFVLAVFLQISRTNYVLTSNLNEIFTYNYINGKKLNSFNSNFSLSSKDSITIVYDSKKQESLKCMKNIEKTLDYMKKTYVDFDISTNSTRIPLYNKTLIIATNTFNNSLRPEEIEEFVINGGNVIIGIYPTINPWYQMIYRKLGIYELDENIKFHGIKFYDDFLLNSKGMNFEGEYINGEALNVRLEGHCKVYASSYEDIPLIWDISEGKGKFLIINSDMLTQKYNRGILSGALMKINNNYIYPIFNMKLMFIDDFPAPIPEGFTEVIQKEYKRDNKEFFRDIWWPDILAGSFKYNIKYTGLLIETYNDRVTAPFSGEGVERNNLIIYGRELLKNKGEIGIHGYNHMPYEKEESIKNDLGYVPWDKDIDILASLKEIDRFSHSAFPNYKFRCYVPPSNIIDSNGRRLLKTGLPDISIIAASYLSDNKSDAYIQEYDISENGTTNIPRITSGYDCSSETKWCLLNGISSIGTVSHFIHPDDVLDPERSQNAKWSNLAKQYTNILALIDNKYTWLRPLTASEGEVEIKKLINSKIYIDYKQMI